MIDDDSDRVWDKAEDLEENVALDEARRVEMEAFQVVDPVQAAQLRALVCSNPTASHHSAVVLVLL